jgi:hypothetical protein
MMRVVGDDGERALGGDDVTQVIGDGGATIRYSKSGSSDNASKKIHRQPPLRLD